MLQELTVLEVCLLCACKQKGWFYFKVALNKIQWLRVANRTGKCVWFIMHVSYRRIGSISSKQEAAQAGLVSHVNSSNGSFCVILLDICLLCFSMN